ncbi:hypothetical protein [Lewinella sp. IMCC34183]|uniref:hypothetical protein n=1 Tax=Lewinella sp. IMCC34183 TaxID=2248762 RepID=UPI001300A9F4|nr:hypothetical protein [Lewinella sp. IMCC34183]
MADIDRTVYKGIDLDGWQPSYGPREDYFFWAGRICNEKAPHDAIEACRRVDAAFT